MSEMIAAQDKLNGALQRLEAAAASAKNDSGSSGLLQQEAETARAECESLRARVQALEIELAQLTKENRTLADRNAAAAARVGELLNRLKGVLADQAA